MIDPDAFDWVAVKKLPSRFAASGLIRAAVYGCFVAGLLLGGSAWI